MRIESYSFGRMAIDGTVYTKDLKIIKGRIREKWWRQQGHLLQLIDIMDIVEASPSVLVVGTGASGLLRIAPDLFEELSARGIALESMATKEAAQRFSELFKTKGEDYVSAAFHLTC